MSQAEKPAYPFRQITADMVIADVGRIVVQEHPNGLLDDVRINDRQSPAISTMTSAPPACRPITRAITSSSSPIDLDALFLAKATSGAWLHSLW